MSQTAAELALHPWNCGFVWRGPSDDRRVLTPAQADHFDRDGFVVLDGVLDAALLDRVETEVDRFEAKTEAALRTRAAAAALDIGAENKEVSISEAGAITFTTHLVTRSGGVRALIRSPLLLGLCADLVGPDVNLYWDQAVYKKPEKPRRFPWHQDNGYAFVEPQQYLTCWVPLTDATPDNGCPVVAPGVHRLGTLRHRYVHPLGLQCFDEPPAAVTVPVRRGGVVVFWSLTPHLTGPNVSGDVRKAYIVQYAPAGAAVQLGDPKAGRPTSVAPADDPDRQFPVLRQGEPVP